MANHPVKTAPAAKLALIVSLALIAITVIVLLNSLINTIEKNSVKGDIDVTAIANNKALMTEKNLQPVGEVTASDGSGAVPSATRSGEEVYSAVCAACHTSGAAGAPKIDDKAAWEPRVANGFDALLKTAIDGKGAMPARAGQNVPDDELTASIAYMTEKAGFALDIPKAAAAEPAAPAEATPTTEEKKVAEPKPAVTATEEKAPETTPVEAVESAPVAPAIEAKAPEKEEAPTAETKPVAPSAPAAPSTEEKKAEEPVSTPAAAPATEAKVTATATANAIDGQAIYKTACFACHDTGAANAPKLTDKAIWQPRIALGKDALYNSAINGKATMPPKGGNMALSDDEVKAVVDYMISVAQ